MRSPWIISACLFAAALALVPSAGGMELDSQTKELWQTAAQEQAGIEARHQLLQDANLQVYLAGVLRQIGLQVSSDLPPMQLRIIPDNRQQAVTYPNGICYLTTGMLVSLRSEDQLAMILAHEMSHYLHQHTRRAWDYMQTLADDRLLDDEPDHALNKTMNPKDFVETAELEADAHGLELMQKAGYCPNQVIPLLQGMYANVDPSRAGVKRTVSSRLRAVQDQLSPGEASLGCGKGDVRQSDYDRGILPALVADSRLALQRGSWTRVQEDLKRYRAVAPETAEVLFLKGELLRRHPGKFEQGGVISAYESAIELDPNFAPAYRALGMVHFKLGRKAAAKRCLENYLSLIPDSPDNLFIKDFLRQCIN